MNFERNKVPKETLKIGLDKVSMNIVWCVFTISKLNEKTNRPDMFIGIKLKLEEVFEESLSGILSLVSKNEIPLDDVLKYAKPYNKEDKKELEKLMKKEAKLILLMEAGTTMGYSIKSIGPPLGKIEFIKYRDKFYPFSEGTHFLSYDRPTSWWEKFLKR